MRSGEIVDFVGWRFRPPRFTADGEVCNDFRERLLAPGLSDDGRPRMVDLENLLSFA